MKKKPSQTLFQSFRLIQLLRSGNRTYACVTTLLEHKLLNMLELYFAQCFFFSVTRIYCDVVVSPNSPPRQIQNYFFSCSKTNVLTSFLNFSIDNRWALHLARRSADFFFHNTVSCAMSKIVSFSRFEFKRVATRLKSHVSSVNSCQNLYFMAQRNHPLCRTKHSFMTLLGGTD